ncbi:tRNA-binding protein [candidate division WWE3 bacterium]|uniref:tRNA-binding protein n=1 Tax=candidate division WWE3 bacterium TaxID=2053526 RepID=A0A955LKU7_UNCKA|nr:tRNA-binding protein [candidate division WWE3 bacterium]
MKLLPLKPQIRFNDVEKLDVRVGTITRVSDIPESEKLVMLSVDFGEFTRTIVVGMKQERDDPTEITGQQALFIVNLEPKVIMGIESEGMLFDIGYANEITPVLAQPEKAVPNGVSAG